MKILYPFPLFPFTPALKIAIILKSLFQSFWVFAIFFLPVGNNDDDAS